jgi:hypothetical protein
MKVSKTIIDFTSQIETGVMSGDVTLKSGQLIRLSCGSVSVFDYAEPHYIRAYHGKNMEHAIRKFKSIKRCEKATDDCNQGKITLAQMHAILNRKPKKFATVYRSSECGYALKVNGKFYRFSEMPQDRIEPRIEYALKGDFMETTLSCDLKGQCIGWYEIK